MINLPKLLTALAFVASLCLSAPAIAKERPLGENLSPEGYAPVYVYTINPNREVGFHVGDVLQRIVILHVPKPYKLLETSLPLANTQKLRQNKKQGIEVHSVKLEQDDNDRYNIYTLDITYQVFTNNVVAKPAALPPEFVKISGNGKIFQVRIPSWSFRISPLSVYGNVKIEFDMSPYRGPLLLDNTAHRYTLWALLGVLGAALLGLLYILGGRRWLPRMGGPFARAMRDLRKLHADDASLQAGVTRVHQAINASAGGSVFTADEFITRRPGFAPIRDEVERFFQLSRTVFFDPKAQVDLPQAPLAWLRQFCRRCRDHERGLK